MGPQPRDYTQDMPKKMRRGAIRSALSALARDNQLVFVDTFDMKENKTKEANRILRALAGDESKLVLVLGTEDNVKRSVNNLEDAKTLNVRYLNIRDLLQYGRVIVPLEALDVIKEIWGQEQ
jgi:large subunit ribosomal protein L4